MLWALLALAIVGAVAGSSGGGDVIAQIRSAWKRQIKKHLRKDPSARAAAEQLLEDYDEMIHELQDTMSSLAERAMHVHTTYASPLDDYEAIIEQATTEISDSLGQLNGLTVRLHDAMGEERYVSAVNDVRKELDRKGRKADKAQGRRERKADKAEQKLDRDTDL